MKNRTYTPALVLTLAGLTASLTGCQAIADIFKAGAWVGAVAVILLIAVVGGALSVFRR